MNVEDELATYEAASRLASLGEAKRLYASLSVLAKAVLKERELASAAARKAAITAATLAREENILRARRELALAQGGDVATLQALVCRVFPVLKGGVLPANLERIGWYGPAEGVPEYLLGHALRHAEDTLNGLVTPLQGGHHWGRSDLPGQRAGRPTHLDD